jgi:hypothetical protein
MGTIAALVLPCAAWVVVTPVSATAQTRASRVRLSSVETCLARVEPEVIWESLDVSRDGKRVGFTMGLGEKAIAPNTGSRDYQQMAVVVDGAVQEQSRWAGGVVFSPDGKRVAYAVERGGKRCVVVDGIAGSAYDGVRPWAPIFSADGRHVGYAAVRNGKGFAVVDGIEGPEYDSVDEFVFSPDGKRGAYTAVADGMRFAVVEGVEGPRYDQIWGLVFSPDSRRIAYCAGRGRDQVVVVDGVDGSRYDRVQQPSFSGDGRHVAYAAGRGEAPIAVVDSKEYPGGGEPVFSSDGKRVALPMQVGTKSVAMIDGVRADREYASVWIRGFSPDSRHIAYTAQAENGMVTVVDGELYEGGSDEVVFSPDGRHAAYWTQREDGWALMVDGVVAGVYDVFCRGIDGRARMGFADVGSLWAIAHRGLDVVRIEVKIKEE